MGGTQTPAGHGRPGVRSLNVGDAGYLWVLVAVEVAAIGYFRNSFRRHHGG